MRIFSTLWMLGLLLVALVGCQRAQRPADFTGGQALETVAQADPKIRARIQAVNAELSELVDHPWAGAYHGGFGAGGTSDRLILAPRSGYFLSMPGRKSSCSSGCPNCAGGRHVTAQGDVVVSRSGTLRLAMQLSPTEIVLVSDLMPVAWEGRRYLIPVEDMDRFRAAIKEGIEPRSSLAGDFLLRENDHKIKVIAPPVLPCS